MATRVAINGFGRIGRLLLRACRLHDELDVVSVNDLADKNDIVYLLRHDSVHGNYPDSVEATEKGFATGPREVRLLQERDPGKLPWGDLGVEVVAECTGAFRERDKASKHLDAGARKVVVSAPMHEGDADFTVVMGVNDAAYDRAAHHIVSNASCTTNALAPVAMVLHQAFGIRRGLVNTVHAYTTSQSILDGSARKLRRGRAAAVNLVPTTTGAATATGLVLPELKGILDGLAVRSPNPDGSLVDLTAQVGRETTAEEVNEALREASRSDRLARYLCVSDEELVSSDIIGTTFSAVVDAASTLVLGDLVKVLAWYDNEYGYASRLADAVKLVAS